MCCHGNSIVPNLKNSAPIFLEILLIQYFTFEAELFITSSLSSFAIYLYFVKPFKISRNFFKSTLRLLVNPRLIYSNDVLQLDYYCKLYDALGVFVIYAK